ncbi:MAG TPA: hypothetical protein VLU43_15070, partial [Anaeromyxobacteraceae bacterium]|nr:hypothetical protein [Anaeromyxobacteraceae bacterium]
IHLTFAASGVVTLRCVVPSKISGITITPGTGPAGGYLPLSSFGLSPISGMGDETFKTFNVPAFTWAGEEWTQVTVVSNGYVIVGGGTAADVTAVNTSLPNGLAPRNILAPFWTDLNPGAGGGVWISTLSDGSRTWLVVDWGGVPNASPGVDNNFEIWILLKTGANTTGAEGVTFSYGTHSAGNSSGLTIGAQDRSGAVGATLYFNGTGTLPADNSEYVVQTTP